MSTIEQGRALARPRPLPELSQVVEENRRVIRGGVGPTGSGLDWPLVSRPGSAPLWGRSTGATETSLSPLSRG